MRERGRPLRQDIAAIFNEKLIYETGVIMLHVGTQKYKYLSRSW